MVKKNACGSKAQAFFIFKCSFVDSIMCCVSFDNLKKLTTNRNLNCEHKSLEIKNFHANSECVEYNYS